MNEPLALAALRQMRHMEPNWDSYRAAPIDPRAVDRAILILDSLSGDWHPVPMSDGGVQLELHSGGFDIEITIRTNRTEISTCSRSGAPMPNDRIPAIVSHMREWLRVAADRPLMQYALDREAVRQFVSQFSDEPTAPRTREEAEKIIAGWDIECCGRKLHIGGSCSICDNDE